MKRTITVLAAVALTFGLAGTANADDEAPVPERPEPWASINAWGISKAEVWVHAYELPPGHVESTKGAKYRVVRINPRTDRVRLLARGTVDGNDSDHIRVRLHNERRVRVAVYSGHKRLARAWVTGSNWLYG